MDLKLSDKKILLVEDHPFMRKSIRDMLYTLDAQFIVEADNATRALKAIRNKTFDIILADYNLGNGKNGLQLLEEARYYGFLPFHSIFIIISSEQTPQMVLGAMDAKPDEYLTKPFNAQQLLIRLRKNFYIKNSLQPIEKELNRNNIAGAIDYCEQLLKKNDPKLHILLLKKRAELALMINDLEKAESIYQQVLEYRELPWAWLGLGIVAFQSGLHERAINIFNDIIIKTPLHIECYDWLSKAYLKTGQPDKAQETIAQAVELSPSSILRQKLLAKTAYRNNNLEHAETAYKNTVQLSKFSVYKSSGDYSGLAKVLTESKKPENALQIIQHMRQEYPRDREAELREAIMASEIYQRMDETDKAKQSLDKALSLHQSSSDFPEDLQIDLARSCFLHKKNALADAILSPLIANHIDDEDLLTEIRVMENRIGLKNHSEQLIKKAKKELIEINNRGVALFEQGKIQEAQSLFESAFNKTPKNKTILLNLIKISLQQLKDNPDDSEQFKKTHQLLAIARKQGIDEGKLAALQMEFSADSITTQ